MKKIFCLLLSLILCITFGGCSLVRVENVDINQVTPKEENSLQKEKLSEIENNKTEQDSKMENEKNSYNDEMNLMNDDEIEEYVSYFVRPLYNSINESQNMYEKETSDNITIWKSGSTVMKKEIASGVGGNEKSRQYYYDPESGELIFAFVFCEKEEHRLYFKSNKLLRYIDSSGMLTNNPDVNITEGLFELVLSDQAY